MYIARIQLTGFKSFASKTTLEFERGITAVVGPNGSGKSNVADAVRWVLGEQSKGKLRLEGRDEIIFAGNDAKAKASFAEVALVFDNSDHTAPLDQTEIEVSRRLYRSGETEYRLAGRPARLTDITALLAQAGISVNGYSIIGQGMVDSLLLSSAAERKLLFDEAAGIRAPELSREAGVRKLAATTANLVRLRDIAAELEPRLASLERVVATAEQQSELQAQIAELRRRIATGRLRRAQADHAAATAAAETAQADITRLESQQISLHARLDELKAQRRAAEAAQSQLSQVVDNLENAYQSALKQFTDAQTELAAVTVEARSHDELASRFEQVSADRTTAKARMTELETELAANQAALDRSTKAVERANRDVTAAQEALVALRNEQSDGSRDQYLGHALDVLKLLASGLSDQSLNESDIKLLVHKAGRLLSHAARRGTNEVVAQLQAAQAKLELAMTKRDTAVEHQTNITITRRSLEIDANHQQQTLAHLEGECDRLEQRLAGTQAASQRLASVQRQCEAAQKQIEELDRQLQQSRRELKDSLRPAADQEAETTRALELDRCRQQLATDSQRLNDALAAVAAAEAAQAAAAELAVSWQLEPNKIVSGGSPEPSLTAEQLAGLANELTAAEATLAARSTAQSEQLDEYLAVKARHDDMVKQISDLEQAQADIEMVIHELDAVIRSRFKTNMQALATQFSAYFGRLLPGGTASLTLESAGDEGYGIQLKASPAGKRLSSLAALSGGERTLTGVALLAAILRVNPSPFVILDEIDAALDESNSGRLADILTELSEHSQLIVVTHNRQTMQAARMLYGITVGAGQASQAVPLRLEQATAIAAR